MPQPALAFPVPLPRAGQSRAYWRGPASATALAAAIAAAAGRHPGPLLVVARDNHAAHQLEADLRVLLAGEADAPYQRVIDATEALRKAKVTNVVLWTNAR